MINLEKIYYLYKIIMEKTGGTFGIREEGLIKSAISRPNATFDGKDLYPTIEEKIAVLTYSIVKNHSFVDGNKRLGCVLFLILLDDNNINITYTENDLYLLINGIASGEFKEKDIIDWINKNKIRS